jgi:hypothetical protein
LADFFSEVYAAQPGNLELIRRADFVFVLEHVNVIGREGDCEWLAEATRTDSLWRLTCIKSRVGDTRERKASQVTDDLATLLIEMTNYSGFKVPRKDMWVVCLNGTKVFLPQGVAAAEPAAVEVLNGTGRICARCGNPVKACKCWV